MKYYEDKKSYLESIKENLRFPMVYSRKQKKHEYVRNRDKCDWIATTMECPMQYGATDWKRRIITLNILLKYFILLATHYQLYQYSLQNIAMKNYLQFFSASLLTGNPYGAFKNLQHLCKILGVSFSFCWSRDGSNKYNGYWSLRGIFIIW